MGDVRSGAGADGSRPASLAGQRSEWRRGLSEGNLRPVIRMNRPLALLLALAAGASTAAAQAVKLSTPDAKLDADFSQIRGVRELSNGTILIADWIEDRVALADLARGTTRDVMRQGRGPAEVRLPAALHRLRGDTTLVVDEGNNRITILGPDAKVVRSLLTDVPGRGGVRGVDATGAFIHGIPSWSEGPNALPDDSVRLVRWMPGSDASRVITVIQGTRYRKDHSPAMQPRMPLVGFASQDAWAVTPAGAVAVVRATPYHVEIIAPDRPVVRGPAIAVATRAVTEADKLRYMREFSQTSGVSGRGPDGGIGRGPAQEEAELRRMVGTAEWAERFPPFEASRVLAAADGRIWVGLPSRPGEAVRYDVFDAQGRRALQVELLPAHRVAHVGTRGVYVVATDEDGIERVERHRLP